MIAAGVVIVPAPGVERVATIVADARDAWELRSVRRPRCLDDKLGFDVVAPVGVDLPAVFILQPADFGDPGLKQCVLV